MLRNSKRIVAFDHVRGLSVIFMIICHVSIVFGSLDFNATYYGWFASNVLGTIPCAPVFMILLGFFFAYSFEKPFFVKIRRGLKIFALGILLNIIRGVTPYIIAQKTNPSVLTNFIGLDEKIGYLDNASPLWILFYSLDILTFAGISYIIIALLQLFIHNLWQWIIGCVIIIFISPYLWGVGNDSGIFYHVILQPLWGNAYIPELRGDTDFPVFPWLIYPITGLIMAEVIKAGSTVDYIMNKLFMYGIGLVLLSVPFFTSEGKNQFADYFRMYPGGSFFTLGMAMIWISLFIWLTYHWRGGKILMKLNFWSRNITLVYCIQWIFLGFCGIALGINNIDNLFVILFISAAMTIATYFATVILLKSSKFMLFFNWFTK